MRAVIVLLTCSIMLNAIAAEDHAISLGVLRTQKNIQPTPSPDRHREKRSDEAIQILPIIAHETAEPNKYHYAFTPGSLKANITHLAQQFGWPTVVWLPNYDYEWVGQAHFQANNIKDILRQVLHDFPLQAVFYEGNHILVIVPRNIQ